MPHISNAEEMAKEHFKDTAFANEALKELANIDYMAGALDMAEHLADGSDAIAFAEWILKNAYHSFGDWYLHDKMSGEIYSSKQLYAIFKALPAPPVEGKDINK